MVLLAVLCLVVKVAMEGRHLEGRGKTLLEASKGTPGVIADTGAAIRDLGTAHVEMVGNRRFPGSPVLVHTANDNTRFYECADLPLEGSMEGSMDGAAVMEHNKVSIQPVVPVCEEMNLGFQIAQGGGSARCYRDGKTVQTLRTEGRLFTVPVDGESCEQWHECGDGGVVDWGMCAVNAQPVQQQDQGSKGEAVQQGQCNGPAYSGQLGVEQHLLHTQHWWWGPSTHTTPHSTGHSSVSRGSTVTTDHQRGSTSPDSIGSTEGQTVETALSGWAQTVSQWLPLVCEG